nr:SDR family NAD(P)-dependent oxidoreductase [Ferruginibacter sp.]
MENKRKIAIVTGGSRGLGKDMAMSLAGKGIDVIITYRSKEDEALNIVKDIEGMGLQASAIRLDMSDFSSLPQFVQTVRDTLQKKWGTDKFDFLINNAGMGATVPFMDVTEALFNDFLNVHFKSIYFLTQHCVPMMNEGGRIINIS